MATQIIEFNRPNKSVPWGFSIQGGKEFGCPLSVLRVTSGSIADRLGVLMGDLLLKINDLPTDSMTHQQAILQIQQLRVVLEIKRKQENLSVAEKFQPPPQIDITAFNSNCRISTSIGELPPPPPPDVIIVKSPLPSSASFPLPPPPLINVPQASKIPEPKSIQTNKFENTESTKSKTIPSVALDTKKIDLFQQRLSEDNKQPLPLASSLGKFLQNQSNNQTGRDSKDLLVQQTNQDRDTAICFVCKDHIKGSYIEANKKIYCSNHFCCSFCGQSIKGAQFIETKEGILYCMEDFKNNIAPKCAKCSAPVIEEQVMALAKVWHSHCFICDHCKKPIKQGQFHLKDDDGSMAVYCEKDFKEHYEIKCFACSYPIEADDKYLLVSGKNYHVGCFKR